VIYESGFAGDRRKAEALTRPDAGAEEAVGSLKQGWVSVQPIEVVFTFERQML